MRTALPHGSQLEFMTHVPDTLRKEIAQNLRVIHAAKGRTLVEKGSVLKDVFFVLEGRAEVVLYSSTGREVCVSEIGPGDMFGEIAALDDGPRSASIVAKSEIAVAIMRANDFMRCIESSPAVAIWLARKLAATVRSVTKQVFELSALNVQARIHCELLRLAQKGKPRGGAIEVADAPTHADIANRIGTHREAVTREMRALSDMKIIRYGRGSLTIIDSARLEQGARQ